METLDFEHGRVYFKQFGAERVKEKWYFSYNTAEKKGFEKLMQTNEPILVVILLRYYIDVMWCEFSFTITCSFAPTSRCIMMHLQNRQFLKIVHYYQFLLLPQCFQLYSIISLCLKRDFPYLYFSKSTAADL